jgi:hypothetical protein
MTSCPLAISARADFLGMMELAADYSQHRPSSTPGQTSASLSAAQARTVCGKAAGTDLCGGPLRNERPYRDTTPRRIPTMLLTVRTVSIVSSDLHSWSGRAAR